jgi:DNA primase
LHAFPQAEVVGVPGTATFRPEWVSRFKLLTVWLFADADRAGRGLRRRAHELLDPVAWSVHDVFVPPPWKDLDAWRHGTGEAFRSNLCDAIQRAAYRRQPA